jgi:predicted extracellular nuclease
MKIIMSKVIISLVAGLFTLFTVTIKRGYSQAIISPPVRLMFYNVENLFDIYNDSLKDDNDFLPYGLMRWNSKRYNRKINSLYKTIIAAGEWNAPDIIALCEVENKRVLEDLVYNTNMIKYDYHIIHEESPDQRGIDVCMIYRNDHIKLIGYHYWIPYGIKGEEFTSRSILYTKLLIDTDTIHIIINHWPSRRGGVLAAESLRTSIALMVRDKVDSIFKREQGSAKIIIMGDFNSTPDDQEMKLLLGSSNSFSCLRNLSADLAVEGMGTYRYMGTWEMIDQVIVTEKFLKSKYGLFTDLKMLKIFKPEFLLTRDPKYPGLTPFSTYKGYRYQGGYSDHLPVILDLKSRSPAPTD